MTEIQRSADGRVESIKIPMGDAATDENAKILQAKLQAQQAEAATFNPRKIAKAVWEGMNQVSLKGDEKERGLNWRYVSRLINSLNTPGKMGPAERVKFVQDLPDFWTTVVALGTEEQRNWVKKRLTKFAKLYGFDIELPDDPKTLKKLIREFTEHENLEKVDADAKQPA